MTTPAERFRAPVALLIIANLLLQTAACAQPAPEGFSTDVLASGFDTPVALAQAEDGRLFVAEKDGNIYCLPADFSGDVLEGALQPCATLDLYTLAESGLLNIVLDPDFTNNGVLYAFATVSPTEQQILKLTLEGDTFGQPTVVRNNLPTSGSNHNGGGMAIGPDGLLYFAIGENGEGDNAQDLTTLAGKISRIATDGTVPADNPFTTPTGSPRAVYALGLRNPFRFDIAPDGRIFLSDVGSSGGQRYEEINLIEAGGNYGWPDEEGQPGEADTIAPIFAYQEEGSSITGIAYYDGAQFPAEYRGDLFHLDYVSNRLFHVSLDGGAATRQDIFMTTGAGPVDLKVSNVGSLLIVEMFSGDIRRVQFDAGVATSDDPNGNGNANDNGGPLGPSNPMASPCGLGAFAAALFCSLGLSLMKVRRRA